MLGLPEKVDPDFETKKVTLPPAFSPLGQNCSACFLLKLGELKKTSNKRLCC
jgi:hypothetical protein